MSRAHTMPVKTNDIVLANSNGKNGSSAKSVTGAVKVRVLDVVKRITEGQTRQSCLAYVTETYGVKEAQAREYWEAAIRYLLPSEEDKAILVDKNIARLEDLYKKNYERNNFKECREVISELNKVCGVTGNKVTIAKNKEGEELINITFN